MPPEAAQALGVAAEQLDLGKPGRLGGEAGAGMQWSDME